MNYIFDRIGRLIEKIPVKTFIGSMIVFLIMISGALYVNMSTGSETLVDSRSPVFISNREMEDNFGSDSIIILFSGEEDKLRSVENLTKIHNVEDRLKYHDGIFSIMSPSSIIHLMTKIQGEELVSRTEDISLGLLELSKNLKGIGEELAKKDIPDMDLIEEKISGLSEISLVFRELSNGQLNLSNGVMNIGNKLSEISSGISNVADQLMLLSNTTGENQQLKMQLETISRNLSSTSEGLMKISGSTANLSQGNINTSDALINISRNLHSETQEMKDMMSGGINKDELSLMADGFITMSDKLREISEGLQLLNEKSSMMVPYFPRTQDDVEFMLYGDEDELRSVFRDVYMDKNNMMMILKLDGNIDDSIKDRIVVAIKDSVDRENFDDIEVVISGKPVLDSALRAEMKINMRYMVILAVITMFIILMAVFKIRWRAISLLIIFISVIATLGLMGLLSVPMTMVSMAVFPILIGLGIDYSIQFQNRYEEEKSARSTLLHVGKAVFIAVLATVLGFISLYASPVPMIRDFGKMLTIGVMVSFVGSIMLLLPVLTSRDVFDSKTMRAFKMPDDKETIVDKILDSTAGFVTKHKIIVIVLAIAIAAVGVYADRDVGVETDIETFMPQDMDALKDIHIIRNKVGSTNQIALFLKSDDILKDENLDWIKNTKEYLIDEYPESIVEVKSIDSIISNLEGMFSNNDYTYSQMVWDLPESQRKMFITDDGTKGLIIVSLSHMPIGMMEELVISLNQYVEDSPMEVAVTGMSVLDVEMVEGLTGGRIKMTLLGMGLVFMALLVVYRNVFKAFIPVFPIALIVGMSGGIMYLLGIRYTPITATLGALVLGMGTEMTIMLLERYLEERHRGMNKQDAISISVKRIGKATVASGLTTIGGFSVLMLSKFVILKDFGLMTVINISLALISTFVILPCVLILMDRFIVKEKGVSN